MASIDLEVRLCIYCYKPAACTEFTLDKNINTQEFDKHVLNLFSRHLNIKSRKVECTTNCCDDCFGIIKTFCELYHQIKCLELRLNWQVDKLLNVMRWADRVPSRLKQFRTTVKNFENKVKFRKDLKRKFKQHLNQSFPRVSLSVFQTAVIPKIELLETEETNEEDNVTLEEDNVTLEDLEIISIAIDNNSSNISEKNRNKNKHFLLGWITTLSALIFLRHLEVTKIDKTQEDVVSREVNENISDIPPVSPEVQTHTTLASDHEDYYYDDDCSQSPVIENADFEQDSSAHSMEICVVKEEKRDMKPLLTVEKSYFQTPLRHVENAPELLSLLQQTEGIAQIDTNINVGNEPAESQKSVLPILPSQPPISLTEEPEVLPNNSPKDNSTSKNFLNDKTTIQSMPWSSSSLEKDKEAPLVITAGRRSLRTKYQCTNCKATFSDVNRFEIHQKECLSNNNTESDSNSDNDDSHDNTEFLEADNTKYDGELSSSSEDITDDNLDEETEASNVDSRRKRRLPRKFFTKAKRNFQVKKTTNIKKYICTICTPNQSFFTSFRLKFHEYYKHSNGRVEIEKNRLSKQDLMSIQMDGFSLKTKYTCSISKCGESFLLAEELENHKNLHANFSCAICNDFTANYAINLVDHELEHSTEKQKLENPDFKTDHIFACARCHYKNQIKREFVNHYITEHLGLPRIQAKCPICQKIYLNVPRVSLTHYVNWHDLNRLDDPNNKIVCTEPDCSAYFLTEEKLHLHRNRQHVAGCSTKESNILVLKKLAKRDKFVQRVNGLKKGFQCTYCTKIFGYRGNLELHILQNHQTEVCYTKRGNFTISKDGLTVDDIVLEQNAKYFCKVDNCQEKFREERDFESHSKLHGEFPCNFCPVVKTFALDLAIHEIVHVTNVNDHESYESKAPKRLKVMYKCSRCPYRIGLKVRYLDHFVSTHLNLRMDKKQCPICKFEFSVDTLRKEFVLTHLKKAVLQHFAKWHDFTGMEGGEEKCAQRCDKCSAYFRTKLQLLFHNEEVHNTECKTDLGTVCRDCGKGFSQTYGLRLHRKNVHKVELKFKCEAVGCSKKVETLRELIDHDNHNHTHSKELNMCPQCGKQFFTKGGLLSHQRTHEERTEPKIVKRPHVCEKCGKGFKIPQKLRQHYMFHEGPDSWKFECEICKKKFPFKQKLDEHMRTHTKEKPFICQLCGVAYAHRHNLRNHTNSKHKEVKDIARKCDTTNFASTRKGKKIK